MTNQLILELSVALHNEIISGYVDTENATVPMEITRLNVQSQLFQSRFRYVLATAMRIIYPTYLLYCDAKGIEFSSIDEDLPTMTDQYLLGERFAVAAATLCTYLMFSSSEHYDLFECEMSRIKSEIPARISVNEYV
jgi:hypothetical protein